MSPGLISGIIFTGSGTGVGLRIIAGLPFARCTGIMGIMEEAMRMTMVADRVMVRGDKPEEEYFHQD
jgi:hypothetical protein